MSGMLDVFYKNGEEYIGSRLLSPLVLDTDDEYGVESKGCSSESPPSSVGDPPWCTHVSD